MKFKYKDKVYALAEKTDIAKKPKPGVVEAAGVEDYYEENLNDFFGNSDGLVNQIRKMDDADPRLYGWSSTRVLAVTSLKREIMGEGAPADYARETFANIKNFNSKLYQILSGIKPGYAVIEIVWNKEFNIIDLLPRHPDKFLFGKKNETRLITEDNTEGVEVNPNKFAVMTFMEEFGNRYGSALYQKVYWYWFIKKNSVKFWALFTERFASPILTGKDISTPADASTFDKFVKKLKSATGIKLPQGVVVEILEAQKTGTVTSYDTFLSYLDTSMAIAILGQTLTSDSGSGVGSYALGKIHENVRIDILNADIMMIESFFNDNIMKLLIDYKFANVKEYPKWRIVRDKTINKKEFSEMLDIITNRTDLGIGKAWAYENLGIPVPKKDEDILKPSQSDTPKLSEITGIIKEIKLLGL
ncbi:DUF935 family protein [Candidatus Pacearchaeota archaeon]|nr:DUF935 family protein [Candidatus Pacearchaeota archaeon]